jgi:glycosyltransferase involved in cell wall biosynthesis
MGDLLVSIVVPTYNRAGMLRRALQSLVFQETDGHFLYEILVIDDASTDETSHVVKEVSARSHVSIRYIREKGKGYPDALNRGIKEATGKWITFFDDDQLAESDWLKNLLAVALQIGAGCVGGTIKLELPQERLMCLGPVCRGMLGEQINNEPKRCQGRHLPSGGNMLVDRKVFEKIGYFDNTLSDGGCDSDFIIRARIANFSIWFAPDAIIYHKVPTYRLKLDYFRHVSISWGSYFAQIERKNFGFGKLLLFCIARIGQAILVNVPCLLFFYLKCDKAKILDRKCLLWRALGYCRRCLFFISPKIFYQKRFFEELGFRRRREYFDISEDVSGKDTRAYQEGMV